MAKREIIGTVGVQKDEIMAKIKELSIMPTNITASYKERQFGTTNTSRRSKS